MSPAHLLKPDGSPICPEAEAREAMSDAEFWEHVYHPNGHVEEFDPDEYEVPTNQLDPCVVCGERGPCAYDAEARPMMHLVPEEDA